MGLNISFDPSRSRDTISLNSHDIRNYKLASQIKMNRDKSGKNIFKINDLKQKSTI